MLLAGPHGKEVPPISFAFALCPEDKSLTCMETPEGSPGTLQGPGRQGSVSHSSVMQRCHLEGKHSQGPPGLPR